jgi:hypothetical protein
MKVIEPGDQVQLGKDKTEEMMHIERIAIDLEEEREDTVEVGTGTVDVTGEIEGFTMEADMKEEEEIAIEIVEGDMIGIGLEATIELVEIDTKGDAMTHIEEVFVTEEKRRKEAGFHQNRIIGIHKSLALQILVTN